MNYYERHIGDYLKDTAHLSLLEHGIYGRLLDVYYTRETAIPVAQVERLIGVRSKDERKALADVLSEFFIVDATALRHSRCDREIAKYQDKQRKASASANARWSKQSTHTEGNANASSDAMRTHTEGNAHQTPVTSNQTPEAKTKPARERASLPACPDGVTEETWRDWLALRKAKRAPVSETVIREAQAESVKAGMTFDAFLRVWCVRGSQGLQADWLKPHERGGTVQPISRFIKGTSLDPEFRGYEDHATAALR